MITVRFTAIGVGETVNAAIENLRFDLEELLRRTGDGGEAELTDYVEVYENEC